MKKYVAVLISLIGLLLGSTAFTDQNSVLMYVRDDSRDFPLMLEDEVLVMKNMLEAGGYNVVLVTTNGEDIEAGGFSIKVNYKLADVSMDNYGAIALPCMAPPIGAPLEAKVVGLIKEAAASNKPIAASRGSVAFVAEAGVLKDKRYALASKARLPALPMFEDGTFVGTGTQRDDLLSTNGICPLPAKLLELPDGTADLTRSFIQSLEERS